MVLKSIVAWTRSPGAAGVLQAVFYAAAALWLMGVLGAAGWAWLRLNLPELQLAALQISTVLVAAAGVALFGTLAELYGQHARDLSAKHIYETLRRGQTAPEYTVYLRPFASTGEISDVRLGGPMPGLGGVGLAGEQIELEAQMERAVRPLGQLVALGKPLEHIGAGRVLVDENEWREAIKLLVAKARLIIMLPSSRLGTLEEIAMLIDTGLIERTVLIDPPNISRSKKFNQPQEWAKVREAFSKRGFTVPEDSRAGLLVFFGGERAPKFKERLDIDAEDRIERLFRRVIRFTTSRLAQA